MAALYFEQWETTTPAGGKNKAIKLMHPYPVRTIMRPSAHSVPVMLFDLMQGHSGVRSNGDLAHLLFQEKGSSWPAVTAQLPYICIPAKVGVRSPMVLQQSSSVNSSCHCCRGGHPSRSHQLAP